MYLLPTNLFAVLMLLLVNHCSVVLSLSIDFFSGPIRQKVLTLSEEEGGRPLQGFIDPRINGGRQLDWAWKSLGEPLNIIISNQSDPFVLTESGFQTYTKSIGFSSECLGLHYGDLHYADLGDGDGKKEEEYLARQYYFPVWGTCWESFAGGNHFRAWKQVNSGAWFLAVSKEHHSAKNHMIIPDGYNIGRDLLVERAIAGTRWAGMWWIAEVEWRAGLLEPGSEGVNHDIEQDGLVAVLTVTRL